jgi:tetratricopeptide (TPR) repeat protein
MNTDNQNMTLALLLQSLEDDCNPQVRMRILEQLKNSNPTDEALLGAKILLEENNWDYTVLKKAFATTENRIDILASNTKKKNNSKYLKYAAVVLPIAFVLGYFVNQSLSNKPNIEQFYTKEEGLPNYMGTEKTNWDTLMQLYRVNKMKEAFTISQQILTQKPQNDTAIYFHGVISYELKDYKTAKTDYTKITQNKESVFYYDAVFRLGFTLNNLNENKAAQQHFEKIVKNSDNPFSQKAKEVLKHIK